MLRYLGNSNEKNKLALMLANAFFADPLFKYFFPSDLERVQLSFYTFRFIASHAAKNGFIHKTSSHLEGAAIWLPSHHLNRNLIDQLRFGALDMLLKQGREAIQRQKSASAHMQLLHKKLLPMPHLYLSTIGVDVMDRGKGYASLLLKPMLEQADKQSLACYLDTHNERNIEMYQRFGFEVVQESLIPESTVKHWAMIRVQD